MTPARMTTFLSDQSSPDAQSGAGQLGDLQNMVTTEGSKAMRVTVRVRFDSGRKITSQAVILVGGGEKPYRVLWWQDDIDAQSAALSGAASVTARG
jgi:hypothetical protein